MSWEWLSEGTKPESKRLGRRLEKIRKKLGMQGDATPLFWHADAPELLAEILHSAPWSQVACPGKNWQLMTFFLRRLSRPGFCQSSPGSLPRRRGPGVGSRPKGRSVRCDCQERRASRVAGAGEAPSTDDVARLTQDSCCSTVAVIVGTNSYSGWP